MELIYLETKKDKKRYIDFIYHVYQDNPYFKDSLITITKTFLYQKDQFTKQSYIKPVAVVDRGQTVAQCMFVYNSRLPALQISFFDALINNEKAVRMLLNEASNICQSLHLPKLIIGLNGHVSYGVGILLDNFDKPISFDSLYAPDYYKEYFEQYNLDQHTLSTYSFDVDFKRFNRKIIKDTYSKISFRTMNMKKFKDEMILLGALCNQTLRNTYLYFDREPLCMYQLLKDLKVFLRPENLIFAVKDGREIGFIFWHPDFNEVIPGGEKNSIPKIGLCYLLHQKKIKTFKVNAIGILPEYQNSGVVMGLIYETYRYAHQRFGTGETNFVWDSNTKSRQLNLRAGHTVFRHYCVYEKNLKGTD